MSAHLKRNIDDSYLAETHFIINGYCRLTLSSQYTPKDIIHAIADFIGDGLTLMQGTFQWNIDHDVLQKMKTAETDQKFTSPTFNICGLDWCLDAYPKVSRQTLWDYFQLVLRSSSLPTEWSYVNLYIYIKCKETLSSWVTITKFTREPSNNIIKVFWPNYSMKWKPRQSPINSLEKLTFIVSIKINKIVLKNQDYVYYKRQLIIPKYRKFQWKIDNDLLFQMKKSHRGKAFVSPIFKEVFRLVFYHCTNGLIRLDLVLCALPNLLNKVNLTLKIKLSANQFQPELFKADAVRTCDFDQRHMLQTFQWPGHHGPRFSYNTLTLLQDVTIDVEIINNSYESKDDHKDDKVSLVSRWNKLIPKNESKAETIAILKQQLKDKTATITVLEQQLTEYKEKIQRMKKKMKRFGIEDGGIASDVDSDLVDDVLDEIDEKESESDHWPSKLENHFLDHEAETGQRVIRMWLENTVQLPQYYRLFIKHGYDDLECVSKLKLHDLKQMGISKVGDQTRIMECVEKLCYNEWTNNDHSKATFFDGTNID